MRDPALQARSEIPGEPAAFGFGTASYAIIEGRLEAVEIVAWNVELLVDDDPRDPDPFAFKHQSRFMMIDGKAFFNSDRRDVSRKSARRTLERSVSREREIVGVTRVLNSRALGERREPKIEPVGAQVGERRGCRRALRQM